MITLLLFVAKFQLVAQQMYSYRLWFDENIAEAQMDSSELSAFSLELDVAALSEGMHQLNIQVKDTSGLYSPTRTALFWKQMQKAEMGTYALRYWFDDDATQTVEGSVPTGMQMIDVSSLSEGLHSLHFQVAGNNGMYSPTRTALFWKQSAVELGQYTCKCFVNDSLYSTQILTKDGELLQMQFDTENMPYGMNTVRVQIENAQGEPLSVLQRFFMKPRVEMVRYEYWVNNDTASMSVVPTPLRDTIHVSRMVDVDSYPFTSKSFNFEMEDGQPYVYAKNHLHVKFYNAYGAYVEDSRSYSDLSSKTKVKKMPFLPSGVQQKDLTPSDNEIRWYKVDVDGRNEVQIAADQACDIELFDAEGNRYFEASGAQLCDTISFQMKRAGEYYLALHDVTGQAENTTIYYHNSDSLYDAQGLVYCLNAARDAFEVVAYADSLKNEVQIPSEFYGLPVTSIASGALAGASELRSLEIPSSVKSVGEAAFSGCHKLLIMEWQSSLLPPALCFDDPEAYGNMLIFCQTDNNFDAAFDDIFQGNVICNHVAEKITLIDGMPFCNPRTFTAKQIRYSRYFAKQSQLGQSAGWEAMVLPFNVQSIANEEKSTSLAPFGIADLVQIMPIWVATWNVDALAFEEALMPKANEPFIVQVPNNVELYEERFNMSGNIVFSAQQTTVFSTHNLQTSTPNVPYQFMPAYESVAAADSVYALNDEYYGIDGEAIAPGGVFVAALREVRPFEAYVQKTSHGSQKRSYLRIGRDVATSMENILQSHVVSPQEDVWYNLQGIRLQGRPAQQGLYIHNGEKVLIK